MKRVFFWLIGTLAFVCVAAAAVVIFADTMITKAINEAGYRVLNVETHLDSCHLSLLKGTLTLCGFELKNPEGFRSPRMVYLEQISISLAPGSLLRDRVRVTGVEIRGADLTYEAAGFGRSNLSVFMEDLKHRLNAGEPLLADPKPDDKKTVTIDQVNLEGGRVTLLAVFSKGKGIVLPLPPLEIRDIGKDRNLGISEAVAEVLRRLGRAALATAGKPASLD